jgi:SPP1 gp7 family putative phage head morphogenesis protein
MSIEFRPLPFEEAIKLFKDKVVLTKEQYDQLLAEVKMRAFTVSRIMEADVLTDVYDALLYALEQGTTFQTFKKALDLDALGWTGEKAYRLDTVFRTNIQSMYQAGHYKQQMEVVDARPYWQYVAVMDSRTRPAHAAMNRKVFRSDDSFWQKNYPPNGYN